MHQRLSILKIDDVHIAKVLSFVNECKFCSVPEMFVNYYKISEKGINVRKRSSLEITWARTGGQLLYKMSFHKKVSKRLIRKYN